MGCGRKLWKGKGVYCNKEGLGYLELGSARRRHVSPYIGTKFLSLRLFDQTFLTNFLPFFAVEITNKQQRKVRERKRAERVRKEKREKVSTNLASILLGF